MSAQLPDDLPVIAFGGPDELDAWLREHGTADPGVWLKIAKKDAPVTTCTYAQAIDVALCHGWIDGQRRKGDGDFYLQRLTPRRPQSPWSKINREKAERLIAADAMHPAGLKEVERAKKDGRWERAYDGQRTARVPDDLQAALDAEPAAAAEFATLNSVNRYAILYRVQDAKRPETRERRIAKYVAMLREGGRLHP